MDTDPKLVKVRRPSRSASRLGQQFNSPRCGVTLPYLRRQSYRSSSEPLEGLTTAQPRSRFELANTNGATLSTLSLFDFSSGHLTTDTPRLSAAPRTEGEMPILPQVT